MWERDFEFDPKTNKPRPGKLSHDLERAKSCMKLQ